VLVVSGENFDNWFNSGGDELMKKIKLLITAVAMVGLVSSSIASADGFAPGEGLYLGGFGGVGTGVVQPKVTTTNTMSTTQDDQGGTFEATEGGLGLSGVEGGGWIGYGYKMGGLYAGLEGEYATGDVEFKLTSDTAIQVNPTATEAITEVRATKDWTGGGFGRIGFYVNDDTLLSFRGGVLVSKFDVSYSGNSETFYGGGPSVGASLTSRIAAIDPNLGVRMGMVYTNYLTAPVSGIGNANPAVEAAGECNCTGSNSEVTGSALSARIGLTYSFFDVNSLF